MMKKLVLTGAGGRLGSYLREPLYQDGSAVGVDGHSGRRGPALPWMRLTSKPTCKTFQAMSEVIKGADMVVHFGAIGDEAPV